MLKGYQLLTFKLQLQGALRAGTRGVGLEGAVEFVRAPAIFGGLCAAYELLWGAGGREELLDRFRLAAMGKSKPPFLLTSAFPFAGNVYFLPRPLIPVVREKNKEGHEIKALKKLKKIRWVTPPVFRQLLQNNSWEINDQLLWHDGKVLFDSNSLAVLQQELPGLRSIWYLETTPHVVLDRINNSSQIWHLGRVCYAPQCGLWVTFACHTNETERLRAAVKLLGDTGLGGKRVFGYGRFIPLEVDRDNSPVNELLKNTNKENAITIPGEKSRQDDSSIVKARFITLAPFVPASREILASLIGNNRDNTGYELVAERSWVGSLWGNGIFNRQYMMFGEGSVLHWPGHQPGALLEVTPAGCPHPVYRYAFAFPVFADHSACNQREGREG